MILKCLQCITLLKAVTGEYMYVPDGMYAVATFNKYAKKSIYVSLIYPNQNWVMLHDNDTDPFIFTPPSFQIEFQTKHTEGHFAFKVHWFYYQSDICKNEFQITGSELIPVSDTSCATTFTAPNRAQLVGFQQADMPLTTLRLSAVFEGNSINGSYRGNLHDAYTDGVWSRGNQFTIYTFGYTLNKANRTLFLGMDDAYDKIKYFTGLDCPSNPCNISIESFYGVSAVITASNNVDYLGRLKYLSLNCSLKIYEGQIDDEHLLTSVQSIPPSYDLNLFPMAVKNQVKIYVLEQGTLRVLLARNPYDVSYQLVYIDRYVDIHSFDVGRMSFKQDTFENFTTKYLITSLFNFNVSYVDLSEPATALQIRIFRNNNVVFNEKYTTKNPPPSTTFKVLGDTMTVNYQTHTAQTKGFKAELLVTENDETSTVIPSTTKFKPETTTKRGFGKFSKLSLLICGLNLFSKYLF